MKKLFKAGFAVLAIALLTSSALAYSPVWNAVPDVLVGDSDLVFTDAIDIFGYVTDEDNPTTSLKIVFAEGPWNPAVQRSSQVMDGNATIAMDINSKGEVNYTGGGDTELADNSLMGDSAKYITTSSNGNLTFTADDGADRAVVYIASDGITPPSVSKVFRVRGDSAAADDISFPILAVNVVSYDTTAEFASWNFTSLFAPTSGSGSNALSISTTAGNNADFAWWQLSNTSTDIPYVANQVFRGRFEIQSTEAPAGWVQIQPRIFQSNNAENAKLNVSANGNVPAANTPQTYELFYQPTDGGTAATLLTGMYLIDTDANNGGTYTLNSVVIDLLVGLDSLFSQEYVVDAAGDSTFASVQQLSFSTEITGTATADSFTWSASTANTLAFAIGQINSGATFAANKLYRVVDTISSTAAAATMPIFKLRLFDDANLIVSERELVGQGVGSSGHMPNSGGKDLQVYLSSAGIDGQEIRFSFDFINNDPAKSGAITWDRAVVESVDLGSIP
jgi:hypothetical protein